MPRKLSTEDALRRSLRRALRACKAVRLSRKASAETKLKAAKDAVRFTRQLAEVEVKLAAASRLRPQNQHSTAIAPPPSSAPDTEDTRALLLSPPSPPTVEASPTLAAAAPEPPLTAQQARAMEDLKTLLRRGGVPVEDNAPPDPAVVRKMEEPKPPSRPPESLAPKSIVDPKAESIAAGKKLVDDIRAETVRHMYVNIGQPEYWRLSELEKQFEAWKLNVKPAHSGALAEVTEYAKSQDLELIRARVLCALVDNFTFDRRRVTSDYALLVNSPRTDIRKLFRQTQLKRKPNLKPRELLPQRLKNFMNGCGLLDNAAEIRTWWIDFEEIVLAEYGNSGLQQLQRTLKTIDPSGEPLPVRKPPDDPCALKQKLRERMEEIFRKEGPPPTLEEIADILEIPKTVFEQDRLSEIATDLAAAQYRTTNLATQAAHKIFSKF